MQKRLKRRRATKPKNVSQEQGERALKSGLPSSRIEEAISGSSRSEESTRTKSVPITAEEADRRFDEGDSVFELGFSKTGWNRPGLALKRFNVVVPAHMLEKLDNAAELRGVTRQALVKTWLFDRLVQEHLSITAS